MDSGMGLCSESLEMGPVISRKGLWIRSPLSQFLFSPLFFCLVSTEKHAVLNLVWPGHSGSRIGRVTTWRPLLGIFQRRLNLFWAAVLPVTQKYRPMRPDNKSVLYGNKCCGSLSAFRIWMGLSSTAGFGNELLQDARSNQVPVNSIPSIQYVSVYEPSVLYV